MTFTRHLLELLQTQVVCGGVSFEFVEIGLVDPESGLIFAGADFVRENAGANMLENLRFSLEPLGLGKLLLRKRVKLSCPT